ncbi:MULTISPECIES: methylthioribulose 1-phosphate dehydratase [unclassified Ectothiorhodospira]|uniref:methylthioribulose 1-phosphate dehydratase n=1 Tax=unclassified Ectothiorhodospira TaxID=2684909 RepID=UPI001EE7FC3E|nr:MULTISPECIES: methylthioribulose 1-phosphate dehydratase [unclassified Ectothiorhodospira]MCG5516724.1 methylthioribulose 1-phosphate dehydratase [Ectothiorhodospira sp. 9100]MCG5519432.1 methylthioribulose 1-phosphate dehydratase [Ectothiorhodospira sp. 9905]
MHELNEHHGDTADALISAARFSFERGWMPAAAGNLSARLDDDRMLITEAGQHKGLLDQDGLMLVDLEGNVLSPDKQPSAETFLHIILYRRWPRIGAVIHTHSVNTTVLSRCAQGGQIQLRDYELLKALPGVTSHDAEVIVPVFGNDQDIPQLAARVDEHMTHHPELLGYLIEGHGFYTWGEDIAQARHHAEAFEFLFECELNMRRLTP